MPISARRSTSVPSIPSPVILSDIAPHSPSSSVNARIICFTTIFNEHYLILDTQMKRSTEKNFFPSNISNNNNSNETRKKIKILASLPCKIFNVQLNNSQKINISIDSVPSIIKVFSSFESIAFTFPRPAG